MIKNASILASQTNLYAIRNEDRFLDVAEKQYTIKDLPIEDKPREKLRKYGPEILSTAELLAIVLGVGSKKEDVLHMAKRLVKEYGEQAIFHEKDPKKLEKALDLPPVKACQLVACFELGRRFVKTPSRHSVFIRTARQAYDYVRDMHDLPKEHLRGLYLDAHYHVIQDETISIGSVSSNLIHPREVFRPALEYAASALILVHNHPSGIATPSPADIEITNQLVAAGKIMGVSLLDHIVVTKAKFESVLADYS
jgi:DNA repair protein RadC